MNTSTVSFSEIVAHLTNNHGLYMDGHSGRYTSSTFFVVLAVGDERYVCPVSRAKQGLMWVTTLNAIKITEEGTVWLSTVALHALNHQGDTLWAAARAFNDEFKSKGAEILSIFTVL